MRRKDDHGMLVAELLVLLGCLGCLGIMIKLFTEWMKESKYREKVPGKS